MVSIARQIAEEHYACCKATSLALRHAFRAGELLIQAKAECLHGTWSKWLAENTSMSERTARSYMQLARHRSEIENGGQSADMTIDNALKLLAKPKQQVAVDPNDESVVGLPDLDGETGYCTLTDDGTVVQLWPSDGSYYAKPAYYVHYSLIDDVEAEGTVDFTLKPLTPEGVAWFFSAGPGRKFHIRWWRHNPVPFFAVEEWKPRWPERHSIEKEIDSIMEGPCSREAALRLMEIRDRRLWVGCFISFDSYVHSKWGLDAEIVDKMIGITLARATQ